LGWVWDHDEIEGKLLEVELEFEEEDEEQDNRRRRGRKTLKWIKVCM